MLILVIFSINFSFSKWIQHHQHKLKVIDSDVNQLGLWPFISARQDASLSR